MDGLRAAMTYFVRQSDAGLVVLMLTDIRNGFSTLYFTGRESISASPC